MGWLRAASERSVGRRGRRFSPPAARAHARGFEANAASALGLWPSGDAPSPRRRASAAAAAAPVEQARRRSIFRKKIGAQARSARSARRTGRRRHLLVPVGRRPLPEGGFTMRLTQRRYKA